MYCLNSWLFVWAYLVFAYLRRLLLITLLQADLRLHNCLLYLRLTHAFLAIRSLIVLRYGYFWRFGHTIVPDKLFIGCLFVWCDQILLARLRDQCLFGSYRMLLHEVTIEWASRKRPLLLDDHFRFLHLLSALCLPFM